MYKCLSENRVLLVFVHLLILSMQRIEQLCHVSSVICLMKVKRSFLVAIIPMAKEFNWDLRLQGYILSSFPIGYLTSQLFTHFFVKRFGTKNVLTFAVFTWSLVTFATPFLAPLPFLLMCSRIALGFGEGLGLRQIIEFRKFYV
jgi:MFS family permease